MNMPKISVCATCYNHEKFLPDFVNSVRAQTMTDWELNVVDDCSTDGSFPLLQKYAAKDSRIRVFQNDRNRHVCYTGNRSVAVANGELVTIISCDDLLKPGKLAHDCAFFDKNPSVAGLYTEPEALVPEGGEQRRLPLPADFTRAHLLRKELFEENSLTIPGLTVRKSAWDCVGGYNPLLRMSQDHEFHVKLLERFDVAKSTEATVQYRIHANNLSRGSDAYFNALSNESVGFLTDHFLCGIKSVQLLKDVVPEYMRYGTPEESSIPYFVSRFAYECGKTPTVRFAGLLALYRFLSIQENREYLERNYDFLPKDIMPMMELQALEAAKRLMRAESSLELIEKSVSYRVGLALTWPLRKVYRFFRPEKG